MSQQQDFQPRIGIAANRIVSATLFGIAITTYAVRTYIRARLMKRFLADDYLLLFAVICLIAGTGLDFANKQHEYDLFVAVLNDPDSVLLLSLLPSIPTIFKEEDAVQTIWWFVIFPVKLAFLFFFRRLVHRLRNLKIWWYCITTFTVLAGLTCVAVTWLSCPYFSLAGIICKHTPHLPFPFFPNPL
ncbi:hypothetical protein MMC10_001474 [Thelotrema lepadinum]|nr:hypothetical protein [Thelotrema lepadinum]